MVASQPGFTIGSIWIGTRIFGDRAGSTPLNPGADTPTIVIGWLLTRTFLPTTPRSPAKRDIQ